MIGSGKEASKMIQEHFFMSDTINNSECVSRQSRAAVSGKIWDNVESQIKVTAGA